MPLIIMLEKQLVNIEISIWDRHPDHKAILCIIAKVRTGQMKRKRSKKPLNNDDAIMVTILGMVI